MRPNRSDVDLNKLADTIHRVVNDQGWGCYHPGPGLACCEGLARSIIVALDRGDLKPDQALRVSPPFSGSSLVEWAKRQGMIVETEERAVLVGVIWHLLRTAQDTEALRRQIGGLEAVVRLLDRGERIDWATHEREAREAWDRAVKPPWGP